MGKKDSKDLKKQAKNIQIVVTSDNEVELVSKELNHFGGIPSFFRDWAPGH